MSSQADLEARIEALTRELHDAAIARGYLISGDGFVCEAGAASLIGVEPGTLRNWRSTARPLPFRRLGGPRGRVWYSIEAIARLLIEAESDT